MNVVVKIPLEIESVLAAVELRLRAAHGREWAELGKKAQRGTINGEAALARRRELHERGRKLNRPNLIRLTLVYGIGWLKEASESDLLAKLDEHGLMVGRPRRGVADAA